MWSSFRSVCSFTRSKKIVSGEFGEKVKAVSDSFQIQLIVLKDQEKTINEIIRMLNH